MFGFQFAPRTWAACDGQQMTLLQNTALYSLLGTVYGGDGKTTFNLPDLRGRAPVHRNPYQTPIGTSAGTETVTLTTAGLPAHTHVVYAKAVNGDKSTGKGNYLAQPVPVPTQTVKVPVNTYGTTSTSAALTTLAPDMIDAQGGGAAHDNTQPSLAINFCIALQGNFPPRY